MYVIGENKKLLILVWAKSDRTLILYIYTSQMNCVIMWSCSQIVLLDILQFHEWFENIYHKWTINKQCIKTLYGIYLASNI